jgi:hypothetical protein
MAQEATSAPTSGPITTRLEVASFSEDDKRLLHTAEKLIRDGICENINSAITDLDPSTNPPIYTEKVKQLFYRAWSIAAHLGHYQVIDGHVLVALASSDEATVPEFLGVGQNVLLTGAFVRVALPSILDEQTRQRLLPAENLVNWVRQANRLAAIRDGERHLDTADLIGVFTNTEVDQNVRNALQRTLRLARSAGHSRAYLERVWRDVDSFRQTVTRHRGESNNSFAELMAAITASNAQIATLVSLPTAVNACRNQLTDLDHQTTAIRETGAASVAQISTLVGLPTAVEACRNQLADLGRQTAAIMAGLPRPPATLPLTLAIVGVLALGIVAGLELSDASFLGEVFRHVHATLSN